MKVKQETKIILNTLNYEQVKALQDLADSLQLAWGKTTFKKDTEFDTIWAVASYEAKMQGIAEMLQIINNPLQK